MPVPEGIISTSTGPAQAVNEVVPEPVIELVEEVLPEVTADED